MVNINHKQLKKLLKVYYDRKTPVYLWGTMGIGKSEVVDKTAREIANSLGLGFIEGEPDGKEKFGFIDVRISQLEPSDLRGLPNIQDNKEEGKITKWIIPNWLPRDKNSKGILFFDELNLAPQSIQASAYQLILDRRLGDYKLPDGWVIISAGNTNQDRANVFELPAPLLNRFTHLDLNIPTKEDWVEWALQNGIDSTIVSFLEFKPSFLYKFDRNNKDKAFATPRSWEFTSNLIKDNKELTLEEKHILIASAVGDGIATELLAFLRLQNKIDLKKILENPKCVKDIKEIDLKYSLLSAIVEKYREDKKTLPKVLEVCNYLEPEFAILLLRFLKSSKKEFMTDVVKIVVWKELATKYAKYLLDLKED